MFKVLGYVMILFLLLGCDKDHTAINDTIMVDDTLLSEQNDTDSSNVTIPIDINDTDDDTLLSEQNNTDSSNATIPIDINDTDETYNTNNITAELNLSLETYYFQQWYLEKNEMFYTENNIEDNSSIHAGDMLKEYTGKGVTIAIIDDGLDMTHEELTGSVIATYDIVTKTENVSHLGQNDYHGTAITGIIAANANGKGIVGIARESSIIFLKHKEGMSDSETIELFEKAEALGADIINCSWGTYDVSPSVKETIQELAQNGRDGKGTIIVFAVGNDGQDMGNDESAIPEVIAVGSTDRENLRAWYSNYGDQLDIVAPGGYEVGITTIDPMSTNGIGTLAENYLLATDPYSFIGTSASAPIVSGVIALMLEKNPYLTRIEVEELLKNTSDKIGNIEYDLGHNPYYGYGKINVERLLQNSK